MMNRMNRTEWEACTDPSVMLGSLHRRHPADRKLRLFACACCRRIEDLMDLGNGALLRVVDAAERFADGVATLDEMLEARQHGKRRASPARASRFRVRGPRLRCSLCRCGRGGRQRCGPGSESVPSRRGREERRAQADLLRDLLDTLYYPRPDLAWLGAHFDLVTNLAAGIYRDRTFADLPVLADALEEGDCPDERLIAHCRDGGLHGRGCWVVDSLMGKA